MANYGIANSTTTGAGVVAAVLASSTNYATQLCVAASSGGILGPPVSTGLRRGKIYDILVGTAGTPADSYIEYECMRCTVGTTVAWAGSLSSVSSAFGLDLADVGFAAFVTMNASAETNIAVTAGQAWYVGVNQRASYRWVAAPGSELVYPAVSSATGSNGLALKARGTATVAVSANIMFQEQ